MAAFAVAGYAAQSDNCPDHIDTDADVSPVVDLVAGYHKGADKIIKFVPERLAGPAADGGSVKTEQYQECAKPRIVYI